MLPGFKGGVDKHPFCSCWGEGGTPCGSKTWGMVGVPKKHSWRPATEKTAINAESQPELSERSQVLEYDNTPGGTVPCGAGARCIPPALVAWGTAVSTLASPGTPLTAAAATQDRHQTTHSPNHWHL